MAQYTLVEWATIAGGAGTLMAALLALVAIPIAFRQQRETRLSTQESNVVQIFLAYLESRSVIEKLQFVKGKPDGTITSIDFNRDVVELCLAHLACVVYAISSLLSNKTMSVDSYASWGDVLLKDLTSTYNYLVFSAGSYVVDARNWMAMVPAEEQDTIETLINEVGAGLTAAAIEAQKMAVRKGATEETYREVVGRDGLHAVVAFRVYTARENVKQARRQSWECVRLRNVLQRAFRNGLGSDLREWDIEPWIKSVENPRS